ncbi:hypothetical protein GQ54DRAFT_296232 [Martensiomyces pterosporus]|nr:hypothetical protein GQ54DRAFT_296232 [Martensiomyces pterosporus]
MRSASTLSLLYFAAAAFVVALTDKERAALTNLNGKYHPSNHTPAALLQELTDYTSDAGLTDIKRKLDAKQYGPAGQSLSSHIDSLKADPLVQKGKQFYEPYMMLDECVSEFRSKFK